MKSLLLLSLAALPLSISAADLTGVWKSEFDSQIGQQKYTYTLKQNGTNLTGKASMVAGERKNETEIKEGSVVGDAVSFVELLSFQENEIRITYKGKISADGNEMKLNREVGDLAKEDIVAKRSAGAATAATGSLTGKWKAEFDTQRGLQKYIFTLKQDGAVVTGKVNVDNNGQTREVVLKDGKVTDNTVTFVEPLSAQGNDIAITFTGKISNNEIKFTRAVGDFGTTEAVAKRELSDAPAKAEPAK